MNRLLLLSGASRVSLAAALLRRWSDANGGITIVPEDDSIRVIDPTVSSNNYNDSLNEYLRTKSFTTSQPAPKITLQSDGVYRYQPHNLLAMSERFDSAAWTKTSTTVAASADFATVTHTATSPSRLTSPNATIPGGAIITGVAEVKRGSTDWVRVCIADSALSDAVRVWVNLATGAQGTRSPNASGVDLASTVTALEDGWFRVTVTGYFPSSDTAAVVFVQTAGVDTDANAVNGSTFLIRKAQLNLGTEATTYVKTDVHNLCIRSQEFDNASWTKTNATVTANAVAAPDGTTTAETITDDATSAEHGVQSAGFTPIIGSSFCGSVWAKAGTAARVQLRWNTTGGVFSTAYANFDLSAGTVLASGGGASANIEQWADGWYRCSISVTADSATTTSLIVQRISSDSAARAQSYSGSSTTIHVFGAQVNFGTTPGKYDPTTTAAAYESHVTLPYEWDSSGNALGVRIEEARTNQIGSSRDFTTWWTLENIAVGTTAPSIFQGATAQKLVPSTLNAAQRALRVSGYTAASGTSYIYAIAKADGYNFLGLVPTGTGAPSTNNRAWFNLSTGALGTVQSSMTASITSLGNGWYLCFASFTTTAANLGLRVHVANADATETFAGDGTSGIYVAHVEMGTGSFATSPIVTTTAAVTRAADSVSLATSLFPAAALLYAESIADAASAAARTLLSLDNSSNNERAQLQIQANFLSTTTLGTNGGATQWSINSSDTFTASTRFKSAVSFAVDDIKLCLNGGTVGADVLATMPVPTRLAIGQDRLNGAIANTHIARIMALPSRPDIQALTT